MDLNNLDDAVPDNLKTLFEVIGVLPAEELEDDTNELLDPVRQGNCMTCHARLGTSTLIIMNKNGIGAAYCGGACMQDMAVLGWLQEEHDDIVDRVNFRAGKGPDGDLT